MLGQLCSCKSGEEFHKATLLGLPLPSTARGSVWFPLNLHPGAAHRAQQRPRRGVRGSLPSSPLTSISPTLLQNKCFRYWPDKGCAKEYGCICVRNVSEREAQGYYLRELEIARTDRVSPLLLSPRCGKGLELKDPGDFYPVLKFWAVLPRFC